MMKSEQVGSLSVRRGLEWNPIHPPPVTSAMTSPDDVTPGLLKDFLFRFFFPRDSSRALLRSSVTLGEGLCNNHSNQKKQTNKKKTVIQQGLGANTKLRTEMKTATETDRKKRASKDFFFFFRDAAL